MDCAEALISRANLNLKPKSLTYKISLAAQNGQSYKGFRFRYC
nr:MAG TPA: hypothetical protein [Caudoviricetes sp.]